MVSIYITSRLGGNIINIYRFHWLTVLSICELFSLMVASLPAMQVDSDDDFENTLMKNVKVLY